MQAFYFCISILARYKHENKYNGLCQFRKTEMVILLCTLRDVLLTKVMYIFSLVTSGTFESKNKVFNYIVSNKVRISCNNLKTLK